MKPQDTVYIIENNLRVVSAQVKSTQGNFVLIVLESGQATRLNKTKVFEYEEVAREKLRSIKGNRSPYSFS